MIQEGSRIEREKGRCKHTTLPYPGIDGESWGQGSLMQDASLHTIMESRNEVRELNGATNLESAAHNAAGAERAKTGAVSDYLIK